MNYYPEYTELYGSLAVGVILSYIADHPEDEFTLTNAELRLMGIPYEKLKVIRKRLGRFPFLTEVKRGVSSTYIVDRRKMPNFKYLHDGSILAMSDENLVILKGHIRQMLEIMKLKETKLLNIKHIITFMQETDVDIQMVPNKMPEGLRQIINDYIESE
jgi:hypothetical protein